MITIGYLAKMYGVLPSYVRDHATTFDIMVADVYSVWEQHKMNPKDPNKQYDTQSLLEILKKSGK